MDPAVATVSLRVGMQPGAFSVEFFSVLRIFRSQKLLCLFFLFALVIRPAYPPKGRSLPAASRKNV
jgi:hypothetical protein